MGKIIGILFLCLGVWAGMEVYLEGTQNAFGGIFASGEAPRDERSTPQRAGDAVGRAHEEGRERLERALPD
jgi:hypothetical protein